MAKQPFFDILPMAFFAKILCYCFFFFEADVADCPCIVAEMTWYSAVVLNIFYTMAP